MEYLQMGAKLMCTGCPGVIAQLDAKKARTVKQKNKIQPTDADKKIKAPAFGTCLAIPTAPKKCNPKLGKWMNIKNDVKHKGKKLLLFPNSIPCMAGPGMVSVVKPK